MSQVSEKDNKKLGHQWLADLAGKHPGLFEMHDLASQPAGREETGLSWDQVLADAPDDARFQLEILRRQVEGQPVRLWRGEDDRVLMEAPLWWQAAEPARFAAAALVLHDTGAEAAARHLGPRLPRLGG